jgi:hypothetical protein
MARFSLIVGLVVVLYPFSLAAQMIDEIIEQEMSHPHPIGKYDGVIPGANNPPAVKVPPGGEKLQVTWPGFQMLPNGGSRIFVQLTSEVDVDAKMLTKRMVITLKNAEIAGRTNQFPLLTRFFNTPVRQATLVQKGKDTLLVLRLRTDTMPVVSKEGAKDGYHFVYVDFPRGEYLTAEEEPAAQEPVAEKKAAVGKKTAAPAKGSVKVKAKTKTKVSVKGSASGKADFKPLTEAEMKALDNEKPPPVNYKPSGGGTLRLK